MQKDGTPCLETFGRFGKPLVYAVRVCSRLQYLGIQDAARKRAPVLLRGRAWAGGVIFSDQALLRKLVSQNKWDKGRSILAKLQEDLDSIVHPYLVYPYSIH